MFLGHYVTDDNSMQKSLELDITDRGANVLVKYRNFVNNHLSVSLEVCLKVFQSCFMTTILSNCETWGPWIPRKVQVLYNQGLRLALGVRNNTPTVLVHLETRQPSVQALIRKRQYNFWSKLDKQPGTEKYNLINRANDTAYIKHYENLQSKYDNCDDVYNKLNSEFYKANWKKVTDADDSKTKLIAYLQLYNGKEVLPETSLSLLCKERSEQKILTSYITSSHNLETEKGRWSKTPKTERLCKQCESKSIETLHHFVFKCSKFKDIRRKYKFPSSQQLPDFFGLNNSATILKELHYERN